MSSDIFIKAVETAAQARVSRMFDVLVEDINDPESPDRFLAGVALIDRAMRAATDAIKEKLV
jgi:hypothetical protein